MARYSGSSWRSYRPSAGGRGRSPAARRPSAARMGTAAAVSDPGPGSRIGPHRVRLSSIARPPASGTSPTAASTSAARIFWCACAGYSRPLPCLIQEHRPDEIAIERVFVHRNVDSALKLGQARGAAICAAVALGASAYEYAPRAIKLAVSGFGGADKLQVARMVSALLSLERRPVADAADALAVALCHAQSRRLAALRAASLPPRRERAPRSAERRACGRAAMIASLAGSLVHKAPPALTIEVGGVGYELEAPMSTFYNLPPVGQPVRLLTHLVVREDAQLLYGFGTAEERQLFREPASGLRRRTQNRAGDPFRIHGGSLCRLRSGGRCGRADAHSRRRAQDCRTPDRGNARSAGRDERREPRRHRRRRRWARPPRPSVRSWRSVTGPTRPRVCSRMPIRPPAPKK